MSKIGPNGARKVQAQGASKIRSGDLNKLEQRFEHEGKIFETALTIGRYIGERENQIWTGADDI
jgi:hypothetical protein